MKPKQHLIFTKLFKNIYVMIFTENKINVALKRPMLRFNLFSIDKKNLRD